MMGIEPTVVGMAEAVEFSDFNHSAKVALCKTPSSVSNVTGGFQPFLTIGS